jgi:hypothetical protein
VNAADPRAPFGLFAQMLGWRHLGHRQSALVGQAAAVDAELNYLMATAREHDLLDNDTWSRFFFTGIRDFSELFETWERFTGSFGPDDPEGQTASSRGPELRAPIETMLARLQAQLADMRAALGVTGSSWDVGPPAAAS